MYMKFYKMQETAILIYSETSAEFLIRNCSFDSNQFDLNNHKPLVLFLTNRISQLITFLHCYFYQNNHWAPLIGI